MTPRELAAIRAQAQADLDAQEDLMMLAPLAVVDLCDMLARCEERRAAAQQYDELHDSAG